MFERKNTIGLRDALEIGEQIWFSSMDFNGLFSLDLSTHKNLFCGEFPDELSYGERLYDELLEVGGKIYFIPNKAKQIAVYDMGKKDFFKIDIPKKYIHEKMSFLSAVKYKEYIFMFGSYIPVIICLDTKNNTMRYIDSWYQEIEKDIFDEKDIFFGKQAVVIENRILIPMCSVNGIFELNGDTLQYKVHRIGNGKLGYFGIDYDGENIWCSPRFMGNPIIQLDMQLRLKTEYELSSVGFEVAVAGISCVDDKVQIFLYENIAVQMSHPKIRLMAGEYCFVKSDSSKVFYFENRESCLTIYDKQSKTSISEKIVTDDKFFHLSEEFSKQMVVENRRKRLEDLIEWQAEPTERTEESESIGDAIYKSLMNGRKQK